MRNQLKLIVAVLGILSFTSCEKVIPYKGENKDSLLVVNQIIERDSTFAVQVQRSIFFLESNSTDITINDALVTITNLSNGTSETQSVGVNGRYDFVMVAQEGTKYRIDASHSLYPAVSSETSIPYVIPLLSVDTSSVESVNSINGRTMNATLRWNDPVGQNRYIVVVKWKSDFNFEPSNFQLVSKDFAISSGGGNEFGESLYSEFFALDDASFDGGQKEFKVSFDKPLSIETGEYQFELYHCTEEAYRYLISSDLSQFSGGDPFTEPVKVFANITGGYGIFAGISKSRIIKYQ